MARRATRKTAPSSVDRDSIDNEDAVFIKLPIPPETVRRGRESVQNIQSIFGLAQDLFSLCITTANGIEKELKKIKK